MYKTKRKKCRLKPDGKRTGKLTSSVFYKQGLEKNKKKNSVFESIRMVVLFSRVVSLCFGARDKGITIFPFH